MGKVITGVILVAIAVVLAWFLSAREDQRALEQAQVLPSAPLPEQATPPEVRHPIEPPVTDEQPTVLDEPETVEAEPEVPLPPLGASDDTMVAEATALGGEALTDWLVTDQLVSRIVATVDALDSARVAQPMRPVEPVPGRFKVLGEGDQAALSPQNAERYQPYVDLLLGLGPEQVAGLYRRYYPLFQQAYRDQGYPDAYFNDRLVQVIDHLAGAPALSGVPELRQNEAVYEFVSEDLERLSAGQKMMMRLGPENEAQVKAWLAEFRAQVAVAENDAGR
ncbi:DUF3014 domain-containing protein [Marinihelvus fidelis]|nr:DUF3014 domain-containing protein [Marinihelvus fidelis]